MEAGCSSTIVSESSRGKEMLIIGGAKFYFCKDLKKGETFWRCRVKTCKAKLWTLGAERKIARKENEHNHSVQFNNLQRHLVWRKIKKSLSGNMSADPLSIKKSILEDDPNILQDLTIQDIGNIRKNAAYAKFKQLQQEIGQNSSCDDDDDGDEDGNSENSQKMHWYTRLKQLEAQLAKKEKAKNCAAGGDESDSSSEESSEADNIEKPEENNLSIKELPDESVKSGNAKNDVSLHDKKADGPDPWKMEYFDMTNMEEISKETISSYVSYHEWAVEKWKKLLHSKENANQ